MVQAHRFFSEQVAGVAWSLTARKAAQERAAAIETAVRELLQMVVIDLAADENAQEIFETLNARGAQLTAADLIKNFVFQRLLESGTNVEDAYQNVTGRSSRPAFGKRKSASVGFGTLGPRSSSTTGSSRAPVRRSWPVRCSTASNALPIMTLASHRTSWWIRSREAANVYRNFITDAST